MDAWKEKLEYAVENYFNDCLNNGEHPRKMDWPDAYDCFCGCYGDEFDFNESEAMELAKQIWTQLWKEWKESI